MMNERKKPIPKGESWESPLHEEGSMDVDDVPEMSSLSITDNLDGVNILLCDQGRIQSGLDEDMCHVIMNKNDVSSNYYTSRCESCYDHHVTLPAGDVYHVTLPADNSEICKVQTIDFGYIDSYFDEGYDSKSMSSMERLPFQKIDSNECVTPDDLCVYSQDGDGDTSLHIGIIQQQTSLVEYFINLAPSSECLNICNHCLQTPLHLAVITRQFKVVRRLMTAGARVDVSDIHGNTPLHIACREGYEEIVQCLLCPVYYEETFQNKYEISYQRIPQDLNRRNCDGLSCLHLAAMCSNLRVMEVLLKSGADINIRDGTSGRTVLHRAAETGNRILLEFLLSQHHLDISCETFGGLTPLRLAAGRGFGDVVEILLAHGAAGQDDDDSDSSEDDAIISH